MLELASEIIELTSSNSKIELHDLPEDDPKQREPRIDKAKELLGWIPSTQRRLGIIKTIDYFKRIVL